MTLNVVNMAVGARRAGTSVSQYSGLRDLDDVRDQRSEWTDLLETIENQQ